MNEYQSALDKLAESGAYRAAINSLTPEQQAEVEKIWVDSGTISGFEAIGLWLSSISQNSEN